tara:strand:- start:431 stop:913 length:483 start_codon:yes stop_codon:yes gene_type:complete
MNNLSYIKKEKPIISSNVSQVLPGLWFGDMNCATNIQFLKSKAITYIINCCQNTKIPITKSIHYPREVGYRICRNMINDIEWVTESIEEKLLNGNNVLIFCESGIHNSPSIALIYMLKYGKLDVNTAILFMKSKNNTIFKPECKHINFIRFYYKKINRTK